MSGLYGASFAAAEPVRKVLTTSMQVMVAAADQKQPIAKIHVCNITSGAVTVDIAMNDGTTDFFVEKARSIEPNKSFELRDEILQVGHSLRMMASANASLHAHVIFSLGSQQV